MRDLLSLAGPLLGAQAPTGAVGAAAMAFRAVVAYGAGLALVRLARKRMVGRNSLYDIVIAFLLGSLLSRAINGGAPLLQSLAAAATLVALHRAFGAVASRSARAARLLSGASQVLVEDGVLDREALQRADISPQDLLAAVRLHGRVRRVEDVELAVLEHNGQISVVPRRAAARQ